MNTHGQTVLILLLLIFFPVCLSAQEKKYVTDRLSLGLFEKEKASGKRIATLDSGTELEVLSEQRSFAKVRTADGDVGWVKSAYLISEKPAALRISELESMYQKKTLQLDECIATETKPPAQTNRRLETLEKQLDYKEKELRDAKIRMGTLAQRLKTSKDSSVSHELLSSARPLLSHVIGAIVSFVIGTLVGIHLISARLRKRFYGFTLG